MKKFILILIIFLFGFIPGVMRYENSAPVLPIPSLQIPSLIYHSNEFHNNVDVILTNYGYSIEPQRVLRELSPVFICFAGSNSLYINQKFYTSLVNILTLTGKEFRLTSINPRAP